MWQAFEGEGEGKEGTAAERGRLAWKKGRTQILIVKIVIGQLELTFCQSLPTYCGCGKQSQTRRQLCLFDLIQSVRIEIRDYRNSF